MSSIALSPALDWPSSASDSKRASRGVSPLPLISLVMALIAVGFQLLSSLLTDPDDVINLWLPVALAAACVWAIVLLVDADPLWMWSPLITALAAMGVYHGLGPLLHVFGDPTAIAYANQFAPINPDELARTNLLNAWSLAIILASFALCCRIHTGKKNVSSERSRGRSGSTMRLISWSMIAIALPIKYLVVMPYFLGWSDPDFVLPGFLAVLGNLSPLCLFLLLYHAWSRNAAFYLPAAILFALELATGLLSFNKSEIIIALGVVFLGFYFMRPSKILAATAISVIAIVYFVITPLVSRGRLYLTTNSASISERVEALESAWNVDHPDISSSNVQGWWTRLCYSNAQAFCLRQHDAGMPGNTFELILPAIVPRVLWPDKPLMTPGFEFNQLVTGNHRSSSAAGVFAEAYWNGGWPAVVIACVYLGLLLNWFTRIAFNYVAARDVRWLPFGIGGLLMGASITDWFASTYVGGAFTYTAYFLLIKALLPRDRCR
ncbi:MAG TPA: hypothetical protein VMF91_06605 [Bryobacteraceae bacterium]|nr:hypothetical protein [Bryobacteraceae bacterium]